MHTTVPPFLAERPKREASEHREEPVQEAMIYEIERGSRAPSHDGPQSAKRGSVLGKGARVRPGTD